MRYKAFRKKNHKMRAPDSILSVILLMTHAKSKR